jgi:hypothetical protein
VIEARNKRRIRQIRRCEATKSTFKSTQQTPTYKCDGLLERLGQVAQLILQRLANESLKNALLLLGKDGFSTAFGGWM